MVMVTDTDMVMAMAKVRDIMKMIRKTRHWFQRLGGLFRRKKR